MSYSSSFVFTGYILSIIDDRRICVRIDQPYIEKITNIMSYFYDKTTVKDTVVINVSNARFDVNIDWNELHDLKGVNVRITAKPKRYSYWKAQETYDDNNDCHITTVKYKGVTLNAERISNIRE